MESNAVSSVAGMPGPAPAPRRAGRPTGASQDVAVLPSEKPRGGGEAEFLAHLAQENSGGGLRETYAKFTVDPKTHDVSVEIVDAANQEVIRSIPNSDLRRLAQQYRAQGLVLDSSV